ncbi:MAG: diguanylate cyclase, partial [Proteobacteria bacterium]|nr:diguanylate cyclase [Pseudomonadota bacterium]
DEIVQRIHAKMSDPFQIRGRATEADSRQLFVSVSIGVAIASKESDVEGLLADADEQMYFAKRHLTVLRPPERSRRPGPRLKVAK